MKNVKRIEKALPRAAVVLLFLMASGGLFALGKREAVVSPGVSPVSTVVAVQDPEIERELDSFVSPYAADSRFSGSVLVAKDGKILLSKGYGSADYSGSVPNTPETRFCIGSITKSLTAIAVLQLAERGTLRLDDRVGAYLPGLRLWKDLTIRRLLDHTSGMIHQAQRYRYGTNRYTVTESALLSAPGEEFHYSSTGYFLLGCVIEKVTGTGFGDYLRDHVFRPAGMERTGFRPSWEPGECALGYINLPVLDSGKVFSLTDRGDIHGNGLHGVLAETPDPEINVTTAGGGVYSTAPDLYRLSMALLGGKLLGRESMKAMFTPGKGDYGLGWYVRPDGGWTGLGKRLFEHSGLVHGFTGRLCLFPDDALTVVVLSNVENAPEEEMAAGLARMVLAGGEGGSDGEDGTLSGVLRKQAKHAGLPGAAAAVVGPDGVMRTVSTGYADVSKKIPFTADTVMNIASVSKTVLGVSLLKAEEEGTLSLDADVSRHLPFTPAMPGRSDDTPITLRRLAAHVSGIVDRPEAYSASYTFGSDSPVALGDYLRSYLVPGGRLYSTANFSGRSPGGAFVYSNVGAALAAYVLECAARVPYSRYAADRIFSPLGMSDTRWFLRDVDTSRTAVPYDSTGKPVGFYGLATYPDGGLRTSVNDLSKFLCAVMNDGSYRGARILSRESVGAMLTARYPTVQGASNMGVFWEFHDEPGLGRICGHTGGDPGVTTYMYFSPAHHRGVVLFTNTTVDPGRVPFLRNILEALWRQATAVP